jgi:hypothetical protein
VSGRIPNGFGAAYRHAVFVARPTIPVVRLAWVLVDEAYTARSTRVEVSERELRHLTTLSGRSLGRARDWLCERGLLEREVTGSGRGSRTFYTLLGPQETPAPERSFSGGETPAETSAEMPAEMPAPERARIPGPYPRRRRREEDSEQNELARLLAPLERADRARLNGDGLDLVRDAFDENPAAVAAVIAECAVAHRVNSRRGLLVRRIKRGDHRGDLTVSLAPVVCPECGLGGGRHTVDCANGGAP